MKVKYWITNGDLGSCNNVLVSYSLHGNGRRALINRIRDLANQTKREAWAELVFDIQRNQENKNHTINKFYPRQPNS